MRLGGVVVAGEGDTAGAAHGGDGLAIGLRPGGGQSHLLGFKTVHFVMRQMIFSLIVIAVLAAIGVLTLAGRVVHQRDHAHRLAVDQLFKQRQRGVMRQLAAQVQTVLCAVKTALLRLFHRIDHLLQILKTIAAIAHVANRHGVQHGGDAAGDHHCVVAAHRRVGRPVYLRPRGKELVEVIGMQLDKARQQPAAFPIQRLRQPALAFSEGENATVLDFQRTVDHVIVENQFYVIDNHAVIPMGCSRSAT